MDFSGITRRDLGKLGGALGISATGLGTAALPTKAVAALPADAMRQRAFPQGFVWGTATSAYQIEGAVDTDGRGACIWDTFSRSEGRIRGNASAKVANDHYRLYADDLRMMASLGVKAYRFSIGWPRIFPEGRGAPNAKGIDFYDRLVDASLAQGIEPYATLYHWDLPQALQDRGGWEARDTALAFADYAGYVAGRLSDRVKNFFTMNEVASFIELGYGQGIFAPGLKLPPGRLNQARHHALLAHGLAVGAIRAHARSGTKIGLAENITVCLPVIEIEEHIEAAALATRELNAGYLTAIMEGAYTRSFLASQGADAPRFTPQDMATIASPLDFVGINVYAPHHFISATETAPGFTSLPLSPNFPHMSSEWLKIGPEALYWAPRHVAQLWKPQAIFITENGCSVSDVVDGSGRVNDVDRVVFLRNYLMHLQRATADGVPVRGYFLWSLMDNFEWVDGFDNRFGIIHVDYETQKRTPKVSAQFYTQVVKHNAVV